MYYSHKAIPKYWLESKLWFFYQYDRSLILILRYRLYVVFYMYIIICNRYEQPLNDQCYVKIIKNSSPGIDGGSLSVGPDSVLFLF